MFFPMEYIIILLEEINILGLKAIVFPMDKFWTF